MKSVATMLAAAGAAAAVTISEINGNSYISPLKDQAVTGVRGLVTAKGPNGIFLRSMEPDQDPTTSEGLYVFGKPILTQVAVGDIIKLDGKVSEYRSNNLHSFLTQLGSPANVIVESKGNPVKPLVIGVDTPSPPTEEYNSLDKGGLFGYPNNVAQISTANPKLDPKKYGMDFWESLVGEIVTLKDVVSVSRANQYGDVWVRGNWKATGLNSHGGLTMLDEDANPEAIIIGAPLDATKNPSDTKMGDFLGEVTGVVTNSFGFYRILPLTKAVVVKGTSTEHPPASFKSLGSCKGITVANYNARNLEPKSKHLPAVAAQIVDKMLTPDLLFIQEIQDNSGEADDGTTPGNETLKALAAAIEAKSGVVYNFAEVVPVNNEDGGAPGGNIRQAYLYRPDILELYKPKQGGAADANEVLAGPELKFNPGRIAPADAAWDDSRKPVAAAWKAKKGNGKPFFTVNIHQTSKGGSGSIHGDARPPINGGVDKRIKQATIAAEFIAKILEKDPGAGVITAGDFNEFVQVEPIKQFEKISGMLDLDDVAKVAPAERYTYLYDGNAQALDHMFISPALQKSAQYEHLHLNTWQTYDAQVSDHDPSVAKLNVCGCAKRGPKL